MPVLIMLGFNCRLAVIGQQAQITVSMQQSWQQCHLHCPTTLSKQPIVPVAPNEPQIRIPSPACQIPFYNMK